MQILKKSIMTLALAGVALASQAATVEVQFANPIFGALGHDDLTIAFTVPGNPSTIKTETVSAGRFQGAISNLNGTDPSLFVDNQASVLMYCYDIYQSINHGAKINYSINPYGVTANTLDFLGAVNSVLNIGQSVFDHYAWLHPLNGNQGAAIQLGIWESLYDTVWNIADGSFKVTAGMDTSTKNYLQDFANAMPGSNSLSGSYTMVLESPLVQDMITGNRPGRHSQQPTCRNPAAWL
ncbi:MAG: hypothetical protein ABIR55_05000 [Burkholderiaceae bacterium]